MVGPRSKPPMVCVPPDVPERRGKPRVARRQSPGKAVVLARQVLVEVSTAVGRELTPEVTGNGGIPTPLAVQVWMTAMIRNVKPVTPAR